MFGLEDELHEEIKNLKKVINEVIVLVKTNPNDQDLGKKVRELITNNVK